MVIILKFALFYLILFLNGPNALLTSLFHFSNYIFTSCKIKWAVGNSFFHWLVSKMFLFCIYAAESIFTPYTKKKKKKKKRREEEYENNDICKVIDSRSKNPFERYLLKHFVKPNSKCFTQKSKNNCQLNFDKDLR